MCCGEECEACGANIVRSYRSEREDWIQTMVAAGMGVCFLPEFSATHPGVVVRPVQDPEVRREVCLVTVAGRRWSSPLAQLRPGDPPLPLARNGRGLASLAGGRRVEASAGLRLRQTAVTASRRRSGSPARL